MLSLVPRCCYAACLYLADSQGSTLSGNPSGGLIVPFCRWGLKEPMENMMQMVILSGSIMEGVDRIDRILRQPELKADGSEIPQSYDVEFDHVCFSYEEGSQAVKDVSFHLPQGSITGLVGHPAAENPPWHSFCFGFMKRSREPFVSEGLI